MTLNETGVGSGIMSFGSHAAAGGAVVALPLPAAGTAPVPAAPALMALAPAAAALAPVAGAIIVPAVVLAMALVMELAGALVDVLGLLALPAVPVAGPAPPAPVAGATAPPRDELGALEVSVGVELAAPSSAGCLSPPQAAAMLTPASVTKHSTAGFMALCRS